MSGEERLWTPTVMEGRSTTGAEAGWGDREVRGEEKRSTGAVEVRAQRHEETTEPACPGYGVSRVAKEEVTWSTLAWKAPHKGA